MASLFLRAPGSDPLCRIAELLLSGRRKDDGCQLIVESSAELEASDVERRMKPVIDGATVLEIISVTGTADVVCQFRVLAVDGLILRGVLHADVGAGARPTLDNRPE